MSVYDNNKVYPNLPSAPEDSTAQKYRLQKIGEIETFFLHEIEEREKLAKKFRRIGNSILIVDTGLIITTVISGSASIATISSGVAIPIGIVLTGTSLLLSIATTVTRKSLNAIRVKQKKHDQIILLAQTKLESIQDIISKALTDGIISDLEFERILSELDRYRTLKQEVRNKAKKKSESITDEQREAILQQGRKEGRNAFLKQIANTSNIPNANVI